MSFAWLKPYFPRGLYGRAAIIMLLPVVFLQLVVSVLFTTRHFENVTVQMTDVVVRELQLIFEVADEVGQAGDISSAVAEKLGVLEVVVVPASAEELTEEDQRNWYDFSGTVVNARLRERVPEVQVVDLSDRRMVRLVTESSAGPLDLLLDRRRFSARNPHQLFVNMFFFATLITVVAFIYMRNQLRPIKRLAVAAEAFGKGRHLPYAPSGATEVRAAGAAFLDMRNRIERQIETRTLMLSGVSHDLRTPLTRLRLGLSMLEPGEREPLEEDVEDMSRMIDEFLSFAKGASEGTPEAVDPIALVSSVVDDAVRAGRAVELVHSEGEGEVMLRETAMRRALDNLISNAVRYGDRAEVSVTLTEKALRFRVEDDGPGIPEERRAEAQRPFTRLDPARNQDRGGGVGLGLAIATDIARAHGGILRLGVSEKMGGLRADIVIGR